LDARALKKYSENELKLEKVISLIQVGNHSSENVAIKIDMKKEKVINLKGFSS
jgi:RimJ/RimL family protein N-acetyltransferase